MTLPQDIADRVDRVLEYHANTKHTYESVRQPGQTLNIASRPNKSLGEPLLAELRQLDQRAAEVEAHIRQVLKERGGMPLE